MIEYKYKNISGKPINAFRKPDVYLKDSNGQKYKPDDRATRAEVIYRGINIDNSLSDMNPGIETKDIAVFEVAKDASKNGWTILLEADEDVELPLTIKKTLN